MITGSSLLEMLTCSELFLLSTPLLFQRMTRDVCASAKYWKHRNSHLFLSMFFPSSNQFLVLMLREEFAISPQQGHLDKALALSCLYPSLCIIIKLQHHFFSGHLAIYSLQGSRTGKDTAEKNAYHYFTMFYYTFGSHTTIYSIFIIISHNPLKFTFPVICKVVLQYCQNQKWACCAGSIWMDI